MAAAKGDQPLTQGLEEMRRLMKVRELKTQKQVSELTGISESKLSKVFNQQALPNRTEAVAIWRKIGVDPALWDDPAPASTAEAAAGKGAS